MKKKDIVFSVPLELRIKFQSVGSDKKNKKTMKSIVKWLSDDLKNLYVPVTNDFIGDEIAATITRIKIGKIV